ncbi:MAG: phosphate signaling complex protein PhoU [Lachnospirales bacterium]
MRANFEKALEELNVELIKMGAVVEEAIKQAVCALKDHNVKLAGEIIESDRVIDDMEKDIEAKCLSLILKQQPVAKDLRVVSKALKMVTDMERIGDQASEIAELVTELDESTIFTAIEHIPKMTEVSIGMVHGAITAFVNRDVEKAKEIAKKDDIVDELFTKVKKDISELLKESPDNADLSINFLMIAKYFERIADHAENICEWVEFGETGEYKNSIII